MACSILADFVHYGTYPCQCKIGPRLRLSSLCFAWPQSNFTWAIELHKVRGDQWKYHWDFNWTEAINGYALPLITEKRVAFTPNIGLLISMASGNICTVLYNSSMRYSWEQTHCQLRYCLKNYPAWCIFRYLNLTFNVDPLQEHPFVVTRPGRLVEQDLRSFTVVCLR